MGIRNSMKVTFVMVLTFCSAFTTYADSSYHSTVKDMTLGNRIAYAIETLSETDNQDILNSAIEDIRVYAKTVEEESALSALDTLLPHTLPQSELRGHILLTRASILARQGLDDDAETFFRYVIRNKWHKNAYRMYYASLWECHKYDLSAIDEFHRHTSDSLSDEDREFYNCHGNFLEMFTRLRAKKLETPDFLAMQSVYPMLKPSNRRPLAREIAKALCLAVDGHYGGAFDLLAQIDESLISPEAPKSDYDESKDIPLYTATVLIFEGKDFQRARDSFQEFMDRNQDNPSKILERAVKIGHGLFYSEDDVKKIPELTELVLSSYLYTDETITQGLSIADRASLLNGHRSGLWAQNRTDEAYQAAVKLKEEYYPQTLSGVDAVLNLALYEIYLHDDFEAAESLLQDALLNNSYKKMIPHLKQLQAAIANHKCDYEVALTFLDEALIWIGDNPPYGPEARFFEGLLKNKKHIQNIITSEESKEGAL